LELHLRRSWCSPPGAFTAFAGLGRADVGPWCPPLPAGLDTAPPPGGGGLSAGEAQLITLARLGPGDPGLSIVDEVTARLDPATAEPLSLPLRRVSRPFSSIPAGHGTGTGGSARIVPGASAMPA